ncbi:10526_t:CDS:2, partial [Acaulospora colombiana]
SLVGVGFAVEDGPGPKVWMVAASVVEEGGRLRVVTTIVWAASGKVTIGCEVIGAVVLVVTPWPLSNGLGYSVVPKS